MSAAPTRLTELRVSGHIMTLDPGVFCVFHVPGAPPPDAATGLPGVRLSRAPGAGASSVVQISTFQDDGWLGADGAALVRVAGGPGQVLVTVYQAGEGGAPAPSLRVTCLTAPLPAEVATPPSSPPEIEAHVHGLGDLGGQLGAWVGEPGSERWIEGFAILPRGPVAPGEIEYQAVLGQGWLSPWAEGGQFCGSRGMALPILGLGVRLRGDAARRFEAVVSASFVDGTSVGPVADGAPCEAPSLAPLEAFLVELRPRLPARKVARTGARTAARAARAPR